MKKETAAIAMAVTLAAVSLGACGGNGAFPSKEITMTVPFGSGGSADLLARTLAEPAGTAPVSYTHLTLPTILRV